MQTSHKEVIANRLKNLRALLAEKELDAVLITKRENYIYLSGFTGTSAYLVISQNKAVLVTDFRYVEQASLQAPMYEIYEQQGNLYDALNEVIKNAGISKLGFEEGNVTFDRYNEYQSRLNIKEFVPAGAIAEKLRMIKDDLEISIIKKAVEIADDTFKHILNYIKPGVSEIDIAVEMEYHMKKLGAKGASFDTIVASGKRSSMPHGVASAKKLESGDAITMDFGALYMDYCSDMTRTVFLGQPDDQILKIYKIVLDAQLKSIEGAKKGLLGKDVDAIARSIISQNGYGDNFGHGLGHSVGLEIHEEPRFSKTGNILIENNMVITVEPGIYVNGFGGVRIEDIIVINDNNPIVLTESTKDIIII